MLSPEQLRHLEQLRKEDQARSAAAAAPPATESFDAPGGIACLVKGKKVKEGIHAA
jgi:hypothetical protein